MNTSTPAGNITPRLVIDRCWHPPADTVAVVADLAGFTEYHNHSDSLRTIPPYLSHVFSYIDTLFGGGSADWIPRETPLPPLEVSPCHVKYLGDGALYLFQAANGNGFSKEFTKSLMKRLLYMSSNFKAFNDWVCQRVEYSPRYPERIRFGLAKGHASMLKRIGTPEIEYHGVPINMASRLQAFCKHVGVIASANLCPNPDPVVFSTVTALNIRNFQNETVYIPRADYDLLPLEERGKFTFEVQSSPPPPLTDD